MSSLCVRSERIAVNLPLLFLKTIEHVCELYGASNVSGRALACSLAHPIAIVCSVRDLRDKRTIILLFRLDILSVLWALSVTHCSIAASAQCSAFASRVPPHRLHIFRFFSKLLLFWLSVVAVFSFHMLFVAFLLVTFVLRVAQWSIACV